MLPENPSITLQLVDQTCYAHVYIILLLFSHKILTKFNSFNKSYILTACYFYTVKISKLNGIRLGPRSSLHRVWVDGAMTRRCDDDDAMVRQCDGRDTHGAIQHRFITLVLSYHRVIVIAPSSSHHRNI